jgi:hypothetical protein
MQAAVAAGGEAATVAPTAGFNRRAALIDGVFRDEIIMARLKD